MANARESRHRLLSFVEGDHQGPTGPSDPEQLGRFYDINRFGPDTAHDRAAGRGEPDALELNRRLAAAYAEFYADEAALGGLAVADITLGSSAVH